MRVAIVHYHLRSGGVTRVIEETAAALTELGIEHVILADLVPGLGYGGETGPEALATALRAAAIATLGSAPDVWIFHNPTLGKNRDIPCVIERFAREGEAILQHIHDLAEDGRPANFSNIPDPARLHLTSPRVHHVFINARDRARFLEVGLSPDRAHHLPNPVATVGAVVRPGFSSTPPPPQLVLKNEPTLASPLVFYPVRGIRRKNLGELCLFAALAPSGTRFAIGRAPENPEEISTHDFWRHFATTHELPVWFDVTDRLAPFPDHPADFQAWRDLSTHWITTSVAEGFGQTPAEAAASCKPLITRALDTGFMPAVARGIYHKIRIAGVCEDFADLDESAQSDAIRRASASPDFAASIEIDGHPAREWLRQQLENREPTEPDPQLTRHTPQNVAAGLLDILRSLIAHPSGPPEFLPQQKLATLYRDSPPLLSHPRPSARREFPRAVIFDVYGTLLDAAPGGVRPCPAIDPAIINFLENNNMPSPAAPTAALAELVRREHAASSEAFPEIDLVAMWAELLGLPRDARTAWLVAEIEDLWHPAAPMPGAMEMLRRLADANIPCGLLSNAQANIWRQLGPLAPSFASDLCVFSHQFLRAKPSPALFEEIQSRLARRGIAPHEVWFIGNDPITDIAPAKTAGFRAALFGPARSGSADARLENWNGFPFT
ncbi:MAG: HAD family hydrolase [Luteolibacter sp.]